MTDNIEPHKISSESESQVSYDLVNSAKSAYGEKFHEHLLEEYKIFVSLADKTSVRRGQASKFYISVLSALFALLSLIIEREIVTISQPILLFGMSILGLAICLTWYLNIQSYKQLNSLKFQVLHEMEEQLPFRCFTREWEILKLQNQKKNRNNYVRLTTVEGFTPLIFAMPYIILMTYSILTLLVNILDYKDV